MPEEIRALDIRVLSVSCKSDVVLQTISAIGLDPCALLGPARPAAMATDMPSVLKHNCTMRFM